MTWGEGEGVGREREGHQPLQPDSFSAPMICASGVQSSVHRHDIIFHVIYGSDAGMIVDFIRAGAGRLHSITGCTELERMVSCVSSKLDGARLGAGLGMDVLRALFFLVLNVDMPIKEYICNPRDMALYATAVGLRPDSPQIERMHSYAMLGTKPMGTERARGFMLELGGLVRAWLSNEALTPPDLVNAIKQEYLAC